MLDLPGLVVKYGKKNVPCCCDGKSAKILEDAILLGKNHRNILTWCGLTVWKMFKRLLRAFE